MSSCGDVAHVSLSSRIPEMCQLHVGNSLIPQLGYVLEGEKQVQVQSETWPCVCKSFPAGGCLRQMDAHPHAPGFTFLLHQSPAVVLSIQLPLACCPQVPLPSLAPLPVSSLPLTFHECSLVPLRSPGCTSPPRPPHPEKKVAPDFRPARESLRLWPEVMCTHGVLVLVPRSRL